MTRGSKLQPSKITSIEKCTKGTGGPAASLGKVLIALIFYKQTALCTCFSLLSSVTSGGYCLLPTLQIIVDTKTTGFSFCYKWLPKTA